MVRDAVFFVMVVAVIVTAQKNKLFGAETVELGEFPYMVSLRVFGEHECGGSIISNKYVLTAAHCLKESFINDSSPLLIQYGVVDRRNHKANTTVRVKNVIIHEDYVPPPEHHPNDIALLEGDSGGPLTVDGVQFGIVSWGSNICALEAPSVFTNVSYYRKWIKENSGV